MDRENGVQRALVQGSYELLNCFVTVRPSSSFRSFVVLVFLVTVAVLLLVAAEKASFLSPSLSLPALPLLRPGSPVVEFLECSASFPE